MDEVTDGKVKGGAEKLRLKRRKELSEAGKDPKQRKLSFIRRTKVSKTFCRFFFNLWARIRSFF
jgi:phage terminase Nu1 subunit (DNA packaging protein)